MEVSICEFLNTWGGPFLEVPIAQACILGAYTGVFLVWETTPCVGTKTSAGCAVLADEGLAEGKAFP